MVFSDDCENLLNRPSVGFLLSWGRFTEFRGFGSFFLLFGQNIHQTPWIIYLFFLKGGGADWVIYRVTGNAYILILKPFNATVMYYVLHRKTDSFPDWIMQCKQEDLEEVQPKSCGQDLVM